MVRFLIVDDDSTCRELLSILLSRYGQCDMAHDGREAIGAYRMALDNGQPYDLVCLDIMMPEMDGHSTLKAIREIEKERHILGSDGVPVLMLTASEDPKDCIRAFTEGCECYVPKPIQEKALMIEVRRLIPTLREDDGVADQHPGQEGAASTAEDRRIRCLIVDDDRVCRELLRDMISSVAECDFAYDGSEAVDVVRLALEDRNPYELICLDIMMPGMDGHEALSAIRELEAKNGIRCTDVVKVVMTTALRDSKHCIQSFREGCECYVTKPVKQDEFFGKLQSLNLLPEEAGTVL
jgi:two-component system, chemotaxis family, chemotaxis protein CheY